jgi:uncharacterized protein YyaL (SSP411 family)
MLTKLFLGLLLMTNLNAKQTNKLIDEDSPYLLQHAHNPVNWYPWGEEAFAKAKKENKLIFLSIGYSTCHWCHVMERESFENESVAKILNENFISIKVDREEYPHIDRYYQDIYVLMNRQGGGWPLTIVMTPDKRAFFSGTYLPADNSFGRSGLKGTLKVLDGAYKNNKADVIKSADSIEKAIKSAENKTTISTTIDNSIMNDYVKYITQQYDKVNPGLGGAPKFPHATSFDTLLDIYRLGGDKSALKMATDTLKAMSKGGIYDQIEGGFYRYSVDEKWLIPHFEKMIYTNAELLETYISAYAITKEKVFKDVIKETIQNINERFKKDDLFYSASDADSDGEEGKYFVFKYKDSLKDLKSAGLSKHEAETVLDYFSIYLEGNFEHGQTNPYKSGLKVPEYLDKAKKVLRANREKKNYPFIDYKIQTSWNALYISSLFKASKFVDSAYTKDALISLDSLLKSLYIDGVLYHQFVNGKKPKVKGYLEDYAFLIGTLIEAYQATFDESYFKLAKKFMEESVMKFYSDGLWYMSDDDFKLKADFHDASYRSALAVMLEDIFKISILDDNLKLNSFATESLSKYLSLLKNSPAVYPYGLKTYLQSSLSNVVIKSTKENLEKNREKLNSINYPYTLFKPTTDKEFLACKIDRCFAIDHDLDKVIKKVGEIK